MDFPMLQSIYCIRMSLRSFLFTIIFFFVLFLFTEILLRICLAFYGYPILKPGNYIYSGFYPALNEVIDKDIRNDDQIYDVLILGGSVISKPWSNMDFRLDTILQNRYGKDHQFAIYNTAAAGHTSMDNLIKYRLLHDKRFDLVIYYEAINENRANSIPKADFRADYSHMKWYSDIYMLQSHSEINFTVIPFLADKLITAVRDKLQHKKYISIDEVDQVYAQFGSDIKTAATFKKNLTEMADMAQIRGETLLLTSYATYFPANVKLTGEESDMKYFAGCSYASPVSIWGKSDNVKKGVDTHNQILRSIVSSRNMPFLDMETMMPKDASLFCDVCHVSEPGAQLFATKTASYLIDNKLFK